VRDSESSRHARRSGRHRIVETHSASRSCWTPTPTTRFIFPIIFGSDGAFDVSLDLHNPAIAEFTLYAQAFEFNAAAPQGVYASNGLQLLFGR